MSKIKESLQDFNPWWKEEFHVEFKHRDIYERIKKFIKMPQILALTGMRRVGKTTLMLKIAEDFIANGTNTKNTIYFSFDEFKEVEIRDVIKAYEEITESNLKKGGHLLLLDEVQKLKDWENQIKTFYDVFKDSVKIIISGSESLFVKKRSKETLAGRIFEFEVEPLSFKEFLIFKETKLEPAGLYEKELLKLFNEFIFTFGFPEMVGVKDKEIIKKYIKESIIDKVIYKDIPALFKVKDASVIESIINIFMDEPGQLIEISALANELKISRQSLSNYLSYLEDSFLIRKLYNFSRNRRKVERKLKKYYPTLVSADLLFKEDDFSKSKVFEWILVNQLKAEFFWRDAYKNEVDIVLTDKDSIIPLEVKYGKIDIGGILSFMKKFNVKNGYVISYDKERVEKVYNRTVHVIPAFKFLLKH